MCIDFFVSYRVREKSKESEIKIIHLDEEKKVCIRVGQTIDLYVSIES